MFIISAQKINILDNQRDKTVDLKQVQKFYVDHCTVCGHDAVTNDQFLCTLLT
jgi:hypothetical protein